MSMVTIGVNTIDGGGIIPQPETETSQRNNSELFEPGLHEVLYASGFDQRKLPRLKAEKSY